MSSVSSAKTTLATLALLAACGGPAQETAPQPRQPTAPATLGPGDVFEVRVFGEQDLSGAYRVGSDGSIDFPLVGNMSMQDKTATEAAELLAQELKRYIKNPQVSIFVKEFNSKKVYVFGYVQKPGTFNYEQGMNIIQAITLAGGFEKLANKETSYVTRLVEGKEQRLEVSIRHISEGTSPNFTLEPGDIVYVPESFF